MKPLRSLASAAALCFLLTLPCFTQSVGPIAITASQCASIGVSPDAAVVGIQVVGTWTGTLQPKGTVQGQAAFNVQVTPSTSQTVQATITANGGYSALVAGYSTLQVCGATVASGTATVYLNSSQAPAGGGAGAPVASSAFSAITSGDNTQAAMTVDSGASLTPLGIGQITGITDWFSPGGAGVYAPQVVITGQQTGGGFVPGQTGFFQITITSGSGTSLPSTEQSNVLGGGCASGTACAYVITAPTLTAGQTYTVYSSGSSQLEKQQAALSNCVSITTNCIVGSFGAGANPPTTNTTGIVPSGATWGDCPNDVDVNAWIQSTDLNWHPLAGLDRTTTMGQSGGPFFSQRGFLEFCRPVIFNMSGIRPTNTGAALGNIVMNGSLNSYQRFTPTNVFNVQFQADTATTEAGSFPTQLEGLYSEVDIFGSPTLLGGEVSAGAIRGTASVAGTPTTGGQQLGKFVGVSGSAQHETTGAPVGCNNLCYVGVQGFANNNGATSGTSGSYVGVVGEASDNSGHDPNGYGRALYAHAPASYFGTNAQPWANNVGVYSESFTNCQGCWDLFMFGLTGDPTQGQSFFMGNVFLPGIKTAASTIAVTGSFLNTGSLGTVQLATPLAPVINVVGSGGATNYSYKFVPIDGNGNSGIASPVTSGNSSAVLDGTNYNHVCPNASQSLNTGASSFDVYRTASSGTPGTTGKIGTLTPTFTAPGFGSGASIGCLDDKGLAADGSTAPAVNSTGAVQAFKLATLTNCSAVGTAASPSVASCGSAAAGQFSCATNATGATCTVNTTAVTANSEIFVFESDTSTTGTRLGVTCNTGTNVLPASRLLASSVAATSFTINLGTVTTNPACFSYQIVN